MVEQSSEEILEGADQYDVAFLVVGDPYGATTHTDLVIRAREKNIEVKAIHNASIINAVGVTGLQLYKFGQVVSLVFYEEGGWTSMENRPTSWYDKIKENRKLGLHTLCLLDIKVKEQSIENLARNRKIYEPPRYMTVSQAAKILLETEEYKKEDAYGPNTLAIGVARVGADSQKIAVGTLEKLVDVDMGPPLHSLIIIGEEKGQQLHELELEYLKHYFV
ncbi:Diphthine synthase [Zancudomyces culisetae]|uniref:diphthine methyl ester synthase n=1 Tax=Zancudomyces culisetae TaxID=1213189 RepID=A0A1R1PV39_ZANCU|nr:Diphthine synthase [Zancudomyces culisetae]|eukprot:OMH84828.1 Diphthine synthase [Zancudomyces culisetae]